MTSDDACGNFDGDLKLNIRRVEMRRRMIALIHPDDDPEKSGNFRHLGKVGDLGRTFKSFRRSTKGRALDSLICGSRAKGSRKQAVSRKSDLKSSKKSLHFDNRIHEAVDIVKIIIEGE